MITIAYQFPYAAILMMIVAIFGTAAAVGVASAISSYRMKGDARYGRTLASDSATADNPQRAPDLKVGAEQRPGSLSRELATREASNERDGTAPSSNRRESETRQ